MNQSELIEKIKNQLSTNEMLQGLFLAGSFGRGDADRYSDLDFVVVLDSDQFQPFIQRWRDALDSSVNLVFWRQSGNYLINAITDRWTRIDLYLSSRENFQSRTQDSVKVVIDNAQLYDNLTPATAPILPNQKRIAYAIQEFIRVLGLLYVGLGREEYYLAGMGTSLLKEQLVTIMQESKRERPPRKGMFNFSETVSSADMEILRSLPSHGVVPADIIAAQLEIARLFFPRARTVAEQFGIEWPTAFEEATKAVWKREFNVNWT